MGSPSLGVDPGSRTLPKRERPSVSQDGGGCSNERVVLGAKRSRSLVSSNWWWWAAAAAVLTDSGDDGSSLSSLAMAHGSPSNRCRRPPQLSWQGGLTAIALMLLSPSDAYRCSS
jgi:hypothetical protein